MERIDRNKDVDNLNASFCKVVLESAEKSIKKRGGKCKSKIVPWWTKECKRVIQFRNKAFKVLKRNHCFKNLIEYQSQANVKRVIKNAKKEFWRKFCSSVHCKKILMVELKKVSNLGCFKILS